MAGRELPYLPVEWNTIQAIPRSAIEKGKIWCDEHKTSPYNVYVTGDENKEIRDVLTNIVLIWREKRLKAEKKFVVWG